jgi:hypothetical protein
MRALVLFMILAFSYSGLLYAEENFIKSFRFKNVEICDGPDENSKCYTKKRSDLPNPQKNKIKVLEINKNGMVKVSIDDKVLFINKIEVRLSGQSKISSMCRERVFESSDTINSFATHGIVGDCNE